MRSEIFRFLLGVMLMLVVSALLAFNALLIWVATGPRSLAAITPYIEDALSSSDGSYNVKIGETRLIWDGWKHPVDIRLSSVAVVTSEGKIFTVFPEIALGVDILYLPLGKIMPTSLTITAPLMDLVQNDDRSFGFGFKQQEKEISENSAPPVPFSVLLTSFLTQSDDGNLSHLHKIAIRKAGLRVVNSKQVAFFDVSDLNVEMLRNKKGEVIVKSNSSIHYKDYSSNILTSFYFKPSQTNISGAIEFTELMPDILASLFSDNEDIKSFAVPISGKINLSVNMQGEPQYIDADIYGNKGRIVSNRLSAALPVDSLRVKLSVTDNLRNLHLESLFANLDGIELAANANVKSLDTKSEPDASPEIAANILLKNVAGDKVGMLWPPALSPLTREWVTANISGGKISEAKLAINIKKGDLAKPVLPKEAIDANINIENVSILYLPEHPPTTNVKGKIRIDGVGLAADIESADYLEKTKLSNGHVLIEDLNADNPYIKVDLQADATAKDMVHFLGLPRLKHKEHLGLREDEVKGSVKGEAKVGFNFFAPKGMKAEDAIIYDVKADVTSISQNGFLKKFDVVGATGTVSVNNKGVEFTGSGEVNGAVVSKGNVKYLFTPDKGIDTFIDVAAVTAIENLKRFGYPEFYFLKGGSIGVNAKVNIGSKIEQAQGSVNIDNADVEFKEFGWKKNRGEAATVELNTEQSDNSLKINSFNLNGKKISAQGSLALTDNFSTLSELKLSKFVFAGNNIQNLNYEKNDNGLKIDVEAEGVDLSPAMENNSDGFSFKNFPATQLKADIGKLILGKGRVLSDFRGELSCDKSICHSANLTGETGAEKPYSIKIFKDAKNGRQLSIRSEDAGSFLYALGVLDGMSGGSLIIDGFYKEDKTGSVLAGKLMVSEHSIKNAPLLGKVLSLASLTGLIDTLQGNGISFKEMSIPFTLYNDVITLEKGKTYGSAIGMTVDGTITFPKKSLDLEGTVVPSYSLNSMFGKIPLFGDMLTGGEGQGVFAARYSIKGVEEKADVSVNPLSILTPGFLRGLFDIFDEKKPTKKTK